MDFSARNIVDAYFSSIDFVRNNGFYFSRLIDECGRACDYSGVESLSCGLNRFVLLSGPSCVGKTPAREWLERKGVVFSRPVLYTSRERRNNEKVGVDYHFVSEDYIKGLDRDKFIV